MGEYDDNKILDKIEMNSYKLRHLRCEGFSDKSIDSMCVINEIKYLFGMLDTDLQKEILKKDWLDK